MEQLLSIDPVSGQIIITNGYNSQWSELGKTLKDGTTSTYQSIKNTTKQLSPQLDNVPERTKQLGYEALNQAEKVGATLPDLLGQVKKVFGM